MRVILRCIITLESSTGFDPLTFEIATRAFAPNGLDPSHEGFFSKHLDRRYNTALSSLVLQTHVIQDVEEAKPGDPIVEELTWMSTAGELVVAGLANLHDEAEVHAEVLLRQAYQAGATRPLVAAGYAAMMQAHQVDQQQMRKTGRPYYHHPVEVAAMTLDALITLGVNDDKFIQAQVFQALTHDITEDQLHPHKRGDPYYRPLFSPLTVHYLHRHIHNPFASEAAETTKLMEHADFDTEPWAGSRREYLVVGARNLGFRLTKTPDMKHNTLERKPVKTLQQLQKRARVEQSYANATTHIQEVATQGDGPEWESRYHRLIGASQDLLTVQQKVDALYTYIGVDKNWLLKRKRQAQLSAD